LATIPRHTSLILNFCHKYPRGRGWAAGGDGSQRCQGEIMATASSFALWPLTSHCWPAFWLTVCHLGMEIKMEFFTLWVWVRMVMNWWR